MRVTNSNSVESVIIHGTLMFGVNVELLAELKDGKPSASRDRLCVCEAGKR